MIDAETYLLACSRYIELNPVRAAMVAHPRDYRWSSYRAHADGERDDLLTDHKLYLRLGADPASRHAAYRLLFRAALGGALLTEIREATNKGWALGNEGFRTQIEALGNRRAERGPRSDHRRPVLRCDRARVQVAISWLVAAGCGAKSSANRHADAGRKPTKRAAYGDPY